MSTLFAQSYLYAETGFYFDDLDEFKEGMKRLNAEGIEEVEIQFIDGEPFEAKLFDAANITQASVHNWFEYFDEFSEYSATQLCYLLDYGYSLQDAMDKHEEVHLYFGKACDYAQELIEETTSDIPPFLANYIDYDAIARDMELNSEITEIDNEIYVTNALEF